MSDPIVLSHDADTGITDYFHVLEDGKEWAVESRQDISGLVEVNHELQKLDDGKWGDGRCVASIPLTVLENLQRMGMIDGMFKVAREGFCLLLVGTCDVAHKGLFLAICVTTGERKRSALATLNAIRDWMQKEHGVDWEPPHSMSDHSGAFRGALQEFGCLNIGDCWFHVLQANIQPLEKSFTPSSDRTLTC